MKEAALHSFMVHISVLVLWHLWELCAQVGNNINPVILCLDKSENTLSFPNLTAETLYAISVQLINPQYIAFVPHLI